MFAWLIYVYEVGGGDPAAGRVCSAADEVVWRYVEERSEWLDS